MKKLASRNTTTAIMVVGVLIMFIGGVLVTPPQTKIGTFGSICIAIGFITMLWGIVRASRREHEP